MPEDTAPKLDGSKITIETGEKRGPGRPKGSTTKSAPTATAVSADVRAAKATLESMYKVVGIGLMAAGLTRTAEAWVDQVETLSASNEDALKSSPKLAKWLANVGSTGGAATLIIMHGMAAVSVVSVARDELAERRPTKPVPQEPDYASGPYGEFIPNNGEQFRDPTLIPGT